jgi:methionyl aminopeptidase
VSIDDVRDLEGLQASGRVVRMILEELRARTVPGVTTAELDAHAAQRLRDHGALSAPQLVYDFPGASCISVNDVVVHGVPGDQVIEAGDVVTLDLSLSKDDYFADAAITVAVPPVSPRTARLLVTTRQAFDRATAVIRAGARLSEIGRVVSREARRGGFRVIPELCGHGLGRSIHEDPEVPNFYDPTDRRILTEGLVIAVEPILSAGSGKIVEDADGWTIRTRDGAMSAHHEHTLVVTRGRPLLITAAA